MYPLPQMQEVLTVNQQTRYSYYTKLDVLMQFYTFELDEESKDLCPIATPLKKYQYNCLPMGIKCLPDIEQETMQQVLCELDCEVYVDDIGIFSNSWTAHTAQLDTVLSC